MPDPNTHNPSSTPAQFRSKLATYLTGVAIGFILLGSIYLFKYLATQKQEAQDPQNPAQSLPAEPGATP